MDHAFPAVIVPPTLLTWMQRNYAKKGELPPMANVSVDLKV